MSAPALSYKISEGNAARLIEYVNHLLSGDASCKDVIPAPTTKEGFAKACMNGCILGKLLLMVNNKAFDEKKLNANAKGGFQANANQLLIIDALKEVGFRGYEGLKPDNFIEADPEIMMEITEKCLRKIVLDTYSAKNFPELATVGPVTHKPKEEKKEEKKEEGPMARVKIVKKTGLTLEELVIRFVNQQLRVLKNYKIVHSFSEMTPDIWVQFTWSSDPIKCTHEPTTVKTAEEQAAAAMEHLKALGCTHFLTAKELLEVNTEMFLWHWTLALPAYKLFNPVYEEKARTLAAMDVKDQRIKLWMEPTGKMKVDTTAIEVLKDHVSIFYLIEEAMPGKVDWTKVNKGKLNQFKAVDNWKYAMSIIFTLTRFPPQMEEHQLSGGDETKINVLVDMLYEAWRDLEVAKLNEAELLAWANPLAAAKAGPVTDAKDAGAAYLASILLSLDPKSDMFFDANKIDDSLECSKELFSKCAKIGIYLNTCPAHIAAKDKKAVLMTLSQMKAVLSLAQ